MNRNGKSSGAVRDKAVQSKEKRVGLNDAGNGSRLAARHGQDVRYCHQWEMWLIWDDKRWAVDATGELDRRAKDTAFSIYSEASTTAPDIRPKTAKTVKDWASQSLNASKLRAMQAMAQSEPGIQVTPQALDRHPWLLNCLNGTLDLKTGELLRHQRDNLITKLAPVEHDPDAKCPVWDRFLSRIMAEDEGLIVFLQQMAGYSLTGDVSEQILFIGYGEGANGKSTFLNTLLGMLGDYAMKATPNLLMRHQSHSTEKADLFGKRFVATIETEEGKRLSEVFVKEATGGDPIRTRRLYGDFWEFDPTHKLFLATNHRPVIKGTDHAIWRRIRLIPFNVTIPDAEMDKQLMGKLRAEWPGILNWAVNGGLSWQANGLATPDKVKSATEGYRREMDVLADFFEDRCEIGSDKRVTARELYVAYQEWCQESVAESLAKNVFGKRIRERGFSNDRTWTGEKQERCWIGLALCH